MYPWDSVSYPQCHTKRYTQCNAERDTVSICDSVCYPQCHPKGYTQCNAERDTVSICDSVIFPIGTPVPHVLCTQQDEGLLCITQITGLQRDGDPPEVLRCGDIRRDRVSNITER